MEKSTWTDSLPGDIAERLAECRTRKTDLPTLVAVRWRWTQDHDPERLFVKEDALTYVLDLLDCNGLTWIYDLTRAEYDELKA